MMAQTLNSSQGKTGNRLTIESVQSQGPTLGSVRSLCLGGCSDDAVVERLGTHQRVQGAEEVERQMGPCDQAAWPNR